MERKCGECTACCKTHGVFEIQKMPGRWCQHCRVGEGIIGNYSFCSFSTKGIGRFIPEKGANPHIGRIGKFEEVVEERIETVCPREKITEVIEAIKKVHPYEEIALDIYPLESIN